MRKCQIYFLDNLLFADMRRLLKETAFEKQNQVFVVPRQRLFAYQHIQKSTLYRCLQATFR